MIEVIGEYRRGYTWEGGINMNSTFTLLYILTFNSPQKLKTGINVLYLLIIDQGFITHEFINIYFEFTYFALIYKKDHLIKQRHHFFIISGQSDMDLGTEKNRRVCSDITDEPITNLKINKESDINKNVGNIRPYFKLLLDLLYAFVRAL